MEITLPYISLSPLSLIAFIFLSRKLHHTHNLPPSPPSLPVIGHLHLIKPPLHRTLHKLSQTLGPIFSLRFGSQLVVVVSSPSAVEECFTKNDIILANPPGPRAESTSRTTTPPLSPTCTAITGVTSAASCPSRSAPPAASTPSYQSSNDFAKVEMKSKLVDLTVNNIMRMIAGKRFYGDNLESSVEAEEFRELMSKAILAGGASNIADFLPVLRWIDYKGFEKNLAKTHNRMDWLIQGLIDEQI